MNITAHCLVKNEENFIWYAVNSVINHVDKILLCDTGSSDRTVKIIKSIKNPKIEFEEKGEVGPGELVKLREEMLNKTSGGWILILDGDEVWWDGAILNLVNAIKENGKKVDLIVNPVYMLIGDIFHYQEERAGRYQIGKRSGHLNIRAISTRIPSLHLEGIYPNEAYVDERNIKIQDFSENRILFLQDKYLHASHLVRSSQRENKLKHELGIPFPFDFYYPEVFFKPRPDIVPSSWIKRSNNYILKSGLVTPLKKIKRRVLVK